MKKVFAIIALMGVFTFGMTQTMSAQDEEAVDTAAVEQVDSAAVEAAEPEEVAVPEETKEEVSMYKQLKTKFIEGDAGFMAIVAIALIIGLAFCIERIIYLALADVKTDKMLAEVEKALDAKDVEKAKTACRNTRGPIASICYQGLMRLDAGADAVEKSDVERSKKLLVEALKLDEWLLNNDPSPDYNMVHVINKMQILKRQRELSIEESQQLETILKIDKLEATIKVAVNLLLGNMKEVDELFVALPDEDKNVVQAFPIWKFYKQN